MRILWLAHRDIQHPLAGGAERTIFELTRRFVRRGDDVTVVSGAWPACSRADTLSGVRIERFNDSFGPHIGGAFRLNSAPQPDVVIDDLAHAVPWASPWISSVKGTAFFRHLHRRTLAGQVGKIAATGIAGLERLYPFIYSDWPFVTESESSARDLCALGVPRAKCVVIPPGVDTTSFRPGARTAFPQLIYFGGIKQYKRPEHAILGFAKVRARVQSRLVLVGDDRRFPELRRLSETLGLGPSVEFRGKLSAEELSRVLSESWINVHCSVAEGWGYSILEAAASGVPTVAYRVPGVSESVFDGVSGRLVADGDPTSLANGITDVLANLDSYSSGARSWALRFDWNRCADLWSSHLRGL